MQNLTSDNSAQIYWSTNEDPNLDKIEIFEENTTRIIVSQSNKLLSPSMNQSFIYDLQGKQIKLINYGKYEDKGDFLSAGQYLSKQKTRKIIVERY